MQAVTQLEGYRRRWQSSEVPSLTARERQVLGLVSEGKGNHEIGQCLGISYRTVKIHIANIFEKLGVNRRMQAVAILLSEPHYPETRASYRNEAYQELLGS
ncbi:MAG: helix-turn-helix transcriptional regulator [Dehalococcoidia bacterium]|nr:helix-turn-helix transcriptional regulator [Dehalococcoidia bacterium]